MSATFGIFHESDGLLVEGGFFSKARAEDYCEREYNASAREEPGYDGSEFYVVRPQS